MAVNQVPAGSTTPGSTVVLNTSYDSLARRWNALLVLELQERGECERGRSWRHQPPAAAACT